MPTLSLVMIAKDESAKLARCLESVKDIVDEMIIVDTGSTDNTKEIAISYGAKVIDYQWKHNFSDVRNFALSHSNGDWNLVLDADEYISGCSVAELSEFLNGPARIGRVKRIDQYVDNGSLAVAQLYISRILPQGTYYTGRIHEQIVSDFPHVDLDLKVEHDGYLNQVKSDRNIPILQMEIEDHPDDPYYYYQLAKEYRGLEQYEESYKYTMRAYQLLDRAEGYAPNVVVNHMYNIVATKRFEEGLDIISQEEQYLSDFPDFYFVCGVFYLNLILSDTPKYMHLLPRIESCYKRCIEIGDTDRYNTVIGTGSYLAWYNLGTFYEVKGELAKAVECYKKSVEHNYPPAESRLLAIKK